MIDQPPDPNSNRSRKRKLIERHNKEYEESKTPKGKAKLSRTDRRKARKVFILTQMLADRSDSHGV